MNMTYIAQLPPMQVLTSGGAFTNMVAVSLAAACPALAEPTTW